MLIKQSKKHCKCSKAFGTDCKKVIESVLLTGILERLLKLATFERSSSQQDAGTAS